MLKKQNFPLIIGFAIPLLMIAFIIASVYLPTFFSEPKYKFLYASGTDYYNENSYTVTKGYVAKMPIPTPVEPFVSVAPTPQLFIHDIKTNHSTPIPFEKAQTIKVDPNKESPDGYEVKPGHANEGFFLFGTSVRDTNTYFIVGHNVSKKLNLKTFDIKYYNSIQFIGWIVQ